MKKNIFIKTRQYITFFAFLIIGILLFSAVACKKKTSTPAIETGTMTDRDGNVYTTVKIGNQWWMSQDLKVKTFLNGDSVTYKPSTIAWQDTTSGYCIYDTTASTIIPSDIEWKILELTLGMSVAQVDSVNWRGTNQGDQLKLGEFTNRPSGSWNYCDAYGPANNSPLPPGTQIVWPTNSSGFSAMAGNCRLFNGILGAPTGYGATGFWWSSTMEEGKAFYRYLDYNKPNVFRYFGDKRYGFSIRCVKD